MCLEALPSLNSVAPFLTITCGIGGQLKRTLQVLLPKCCGHSHLLNRVCTRSNENCSNTVNYCEMSQQHNSWIREHANSCMSEYDNFRLPIRTPTMNMAYAMVLPLGFSCPCMHESLMFRNVVVILCRHLASYFFLCSSNGMRDSPIARCTSCLCSGGIHSGV